MEPAGSVEPTRGEEEFIAKFNEILNTREREVRQNYGEKLTESEIDARMKRYMESMKNEDQKTI